MMESRDKMLMAIRTRKDLPQYFIERFTRERAERGRKMIVIGILVFMSVALQFVSVCVQTAIIGLLLRDKKCEVRR